MAQRGPRERVPTSDVRTAVEGSADRIRAGSRRPSLFAVLELAVLLQRAAVTVGAGADETSVTRLLHRLFEVVEQAVEIVFRSGLLDLVERVVDLLEVAAHLSVLVVELLTCFIERLCHPARLDA